MPTSIELQTILLCRGMTKYTCGKNSTVYVKEDENVKQDEKGRIKQIKTEAYNRAHNKSLIAKTTHAQ